MAKKGNRKPKRPTTKIGASGDASRTTEAPRNEQPARWGRPVLALIALGVLLIFIIGGLTAVCNCVAGAAPADIRFSWAQLVSENDETRVLLRVVVPKDASCKSLARFADRDDAVELMRRENAEPNRFPIEVCEALLDLGDHGVRLSNNASLSWKSVAGEVPKQVAIIGDTGCNSELDKDTNKPKQDCDNEISWPFARVTAAAASLNGRPPDLVIHVGDILYHGLDNWRHWRSDFFQPMRPLLSTAPLIIARGNHDNCYKNKGFGWKFLLAPMVPFVDCTNKGTSDADVEWPYAVDLGGLRIVVLDSADSYYRCRSWNAFVRARNDRFVEALEDLVGKKDRSIWFVTHYPIFDVRVSGGCLDSNDGSFFALHKRIAPLLVGNNKIEAVLSGDIHDYEILSPQKENWQTMQFVAGNGGTALDEVKENALKRLYGCEQKQLVEPTYCFGTRLDDIRSYTSGELTVNARLRHDVFGFLAATRDPSGKHWQFQMHPVQSKNPVDEPTCEVPAGPQVSCVAAPTN